MAASLAAELKESLGTDAELIPGGGGVFDVKVDGALVYSKFETGRFPQPGEVSKALASKR
jgi:selenoprotein W-related protein